MSTGIQMTAQDFEALENLISQVKGRRADARLGMGDAHSGDAGDGWHSDEFKRQTVDEAVQTNRLRELEGIAMNADVVEAEEQNFEVKLGNAVLIKFEDGRTETILIVGFSCRNHRVVQEASLSAPVAKELLGKHYGDHVTIGDEHGKVLDILSPTEALELLE